MGHKTYIIHLDRALARRPNVERLCDIPVLEAKIVSACDGNQLSAQDRRRFCPEHDLLVPPYPFALKPGELGCFQSHRDVWAMIAQGSALYGIILEDDAEVEPAIFARAAAFGAEHIEECGLIQFQVRPIRGGYQSCYVCEGVEILRPDVAQLRTTAQMVSRTAARHLLGLSDQIDRPVDTFLQMVWHTKQPLYCVTPSGVSIASGDGNGGSTISARRSFCAKLRAEVLRGRYRRQVKRLSRQYGSCCTMV